MQMYAVCSRTERKAIWMDEWERRRAHQEEECDNWMEQK